MNYRIFYTQSYIKRAEKFLKKHPDLFGQYEKTLRLLELNPFHPVLKLHRLSGKFKELYSVSINISYRVTLIFIISEKKIIPVDIGSHNEVY